VFEALKKDKKRQAEMIHFIFLTRLGQALVESVSVPDLGKWLRDNY
jgi:3-dehydroquinate synthetase